MENAGRGLADHVFTVLNRFPVTTCVAVLCGGGSNGGDGFVCARYLLSRHLNVKIYLLTEPKSLTGDALLNHRILVNLGASFYSLDDFSLHRQSLFSNTPLVIVDAMVGTGFKGDLKPNLKSVIEKVNHLKKFHNAKVTVVSADIPSGLSGDDGFIGEPSVEADLTVTFGALKPGLTKPESRAYVGKIEVVDIGIPEILLRQYAR
jgi:hydroxyethylthiazole kinase-like uncharacterized protein yjeF